MENLIGKRVKICRYSRENWSKYILRETEEGVVVNCYKHIFRVKVSNNFECFRYHELTGNETTQVKVKGE